MKIWVVGGTTGEYSDRNEWTVCAYTRKEDAEAHVAAATAAAREIQARISVLREGGSYDWDRDQAMAHSNPFDPCCEIDYTGTTYYASETELGEAFIATVEVKQ